MKPLALIFGGLALLVLGCGSPPQVAGGADDHGNAIAARVQVSDSSGQPLARIEVVIRPADWLPGQILDSTGATPNAARLQTGENGSCPQVTLRPGAYAVMAGRGNRASVVRVQWDSAGSQTLALTMGSTGAIRGQVVGLPSNVLVSIAGLELQTQTDSAGYFLLPFVPAGTVGVVLEGAGPEAILQVPVAPQRVAEAGAIVFDAEAGTLFRSEVVQKRVLLPPIVFPAAGTYRDSLWFQVIPLFFGESVQTRFDDGPWTRDTVAVLTRSTCVTARSLGIDAIPSGEIRTCYVIEP